jgi:hypothetical protein
LPDEGFLLDFGTGKEIRVLRINTKILASAHLTDLWQRKIYDKYFR